MAAARPTGIQHKHKDFWSSDNPIPSIERFVRKGISEVLNKDSEESDSASETEDDDYASRPTGDGQGSASAQRAQNDTEPGQSPATAGKQRGRLSRLFSTKEKRADDGEDEDAAVAEEAKREHQTQEQTVKERRRSRKPRVVDDPVTGQKIEIRDVGRKEYHRAVKAMDDLYASEPKDSSWQSTVARSQGKGPFAGNVNVMNLPFPPEAPLPSKIREIHPLVLPLFLAWSVITVLGVLPAVLSVVLNAWLGWWVWKVIREDAEDRRWERERARADAARGKQPMGSGANGSQHSDSFYSGGISEGAEWLNGILEGLWEVLSPEIFQTLGGTLEDVMQASIPAFIHAVKVVDLGQGSTPLRLTGLRILPDNDDDMALLNKAAQRELRKKRLREKVMKDPHEEEVLRRLEEEDASGGPPPDGDQDESGKKVRGEEGAGSRFINIELAFVYRARPSVRDLASKSKNAHLQIKFWVGARKLYNIPLPVWVEIKGMVGRVRMRCQLTPDPPFIKNVTVSLIGLPRVGVDVVPMHIKTSNLPFISSFIQSSIDAAVSEYVAPSSLTLDVGEILMGDNIKREVDALGVLVVYIHSASDLEAQDMGGGSDPYCTVSYSKFGKVQYATRVALNDLSPRWEERHVMTVTPDAIRAKEKVSVALWDSDRFTADDMLGKAEVDLIELVNRPGKLFRRRDPLLGLSREMRKEGTIEWSVGFFAKAPNKRREDSDRIEEENQVDETKWDAEGESTEKVRRLSNESIKEGESFADQMLQQDDGRQTRNQETAVQFEPPSPALPSGILSMQIHQISNLECSDISDGKALKRRRNSPGQNVETVESEEESPSAPSAYVSIIINDETVFRTRTKALNSNPYYSAGTERFIRDWRRTLLMFVVHDFRLREADTILGVVPIKLSELFKTTSQVTQFFPIAGGVGHGRMRLSLLFRPILSMTRVKSKLGWNIGTVRLLTSPVATDFVESTGFSAKDLHLTSLRALTLSGSKRIPAHRARYTDDGKSIEWKIHDEEFPFRVPARRRYAAAYTIEFRGHNAFGKSKVIAMSIVWMQDLADDDITMERLPIYRPKAGNDFHRLRQNYHYYKNEEEAKRLGVERVGYLEVKMQFKSGLGEVHVHIEENKDAKAVMEAWQCCVAAGLRDKKGDFAKSRLNTQGYLEDEKEEVNLGTELDDTSGSSDEEDEDAAGRAGPAHRRSHSAGGNDVVHSRTSMAGRSDRRSHDDDEANQHDNDDQEEEGEEGDASLRDKVKKWRDEKKERHRQHRGIKQFKPVRTASWLGSSAKSGGSSLLRKMNVQDRRMGDVETEL